MWDWCVDWWDRRVLYGLLAWFHTREVRAARQQVWAAKKALRKARARKAPVIP